jgi:rhodanese-related sulfurtransferase
VNRLVNHRELAAAIERGAAVIDVLPRHEYQSAHLAGARHIPLARLMREAERLLRRERPVAVYCRDAL